MPTSGQDPSRRGNAEPAVERVLRGLALVAGTALASAAWPALASSLAGQGLGP